MKSLLLVSCLLALAACGEPARKRPHLVLLVVDTLRADRLGAYGSGRETSPRLDRLAEEGTLFLDVSAQSSWTRPSMVSIFSGRYITDYRDVPFEDSPTLAELFQRAGYRTFGVVGNVLVSAEAGFGRGFEHFDDRENPDPRNQKGQRTELGRGGFQLVDDILPQVEASRQEPGAEDQPVLLYVHIMDPHYPYFPGEGMEESLPLMESYPLEAWHRDQYRAQMGEEVVDGAQAEEAWREMMRLRGLYDQEVRTTDAVIDDLLQRLDAMGILEDSVVALVADHGEMLFDQPAPDPLRRPARGEDVVTPKEFFFRNHGLQLDQGLVGTPFLLTGAGVPQGVRFEQPVQNVDLLPTLLELCDVAPPDLLHGQSLVPWMRGEREDAPHEFVYAFCAQQRMVREVASGWKLTVPNEAFQAAPGFEGSLHNLKEDPWEREDLQAQHPEVVARLQAELDGWRRDHPVDSTVGRKRTAEEVKTLQALGYSEAGPDDGLSTEEEQDK